jgi:hypothetical protein
VANPASHPLDIGGFFTCGKSGRGVKIADHLQLRPKSRKRGSIHPLPQCAFMAENLVEEQR